jgi:crotonobetainyl-CoA:carnitine CoA-transferase CaiB-like acyl-CoA transferase
MMARRDTRGEALTGTVVLDLTHALAGPFATMMLGDAGAEVIKVESPAGDETRAWGPPFVGEEEQRCSTYFLSVNRNKKSIVLDLATPAGKDNLRRLVAAADVLVENFRPGAMDRLGFGDDELAALNPRLVVVHISGFPRDGQDGTRGGYDQIVQGESGVMSINGDETTGPLKFGIPIADICTGMYAAFGVVAGLRQRTETDRGMVIDTSLYSVMLGMHAFHASQYLNAGVAPRQTGNHHPTLAPYGIYPCESGMLQIAVGTDDQWRRLAAALGLSQPDPRFATNELRIANRPEVEALVAEALRAHSAHDWVTRLSQAGVPCGKVRGIPEVYDSLMDSKSDLITHVHDPDYGELKFPSSPLRFSDHARGGHIPPPHLGQHTEEITKWLAGRNALT